MNSLNHSENLRDIDLMIAYLRDDLSLEELEQVEQLMEKDALYRAAMEGLQYNLMTDRNPMRVKAWDQQMQDTMPAHLDAARDWFVAQKNIAPKRNWMDRMSGLPLWVIAGGVFALLLLIFLPFQQPKKDFDPLPNLVPDGDISLVENFMKNCGDQNQGFGRGEKNTVNSALIDNYSMGNYEQALNQFNQLKNDPGMGGDCQFLIEYYRAKSLMTLEEYALALEAFETVIQMNGTMESVKNASHWYAGNLSAALNQYSGAKTHFEDLIQSSNKDHLPALMEKNYLDKAQTYLAQMKK